MEKGLEISFQLQHDNEGRETVEALASLTAFDLKNQLEIDFRIFRVKMAENVFYRILFAGPRISKMHPHNLRLIREHFDALSKERYDQLMKRYRSLLKGGMVKNTQIKEISEEYDLWEDPIWQYL